MKAKLFCLVVLLALLAVSVTFSLTQLKMKTELLSVRSELISVKSELVWLKLSVPPCSLKESVRFDQRDAVEVADLLVEKYPLFEPMDIATWRGCVLVDVATPSGMRILLFGLEDVWKLEDDFCYAQCHQGV